MAHLLHNPLARFIVQALLIVSCSRLIGLLVRRIGQPMVIAESVAGIVLGPSLLGWLWPSFSEAVFPAESMPGLGMISQVGVVIFMFLVGLELDPKLLRGRGRSSVAISQTSIVLPFALGAVLALYLYPRLSPPTVRFSSFTLFMGAAMSVTAFPVLARILTERRLLRTKVGAIAITCAAVDDVTAWCMLAFVVSLVRATALSGAALTAALAVVYVLAMFGLVKPLIARLAARRQKKDEITQDAMAATFVGLLLSCWITESIGIHALFGAFLLGSIMPKTDGFAATLAEKLEDLVLVFLLPLFFAFSGLRTQIGLLNSTNAWTMCGLIILVACIGKFAGSTVAARITGLRWREAAAIGILMNTRGLMELVVLNLGLDLGVISPTLFTMMVLMALVTTFLTTPLLQGIYPLSEFERELVDEPQDPPPQARQRAEFTVLLCVSPEHVVPGQGLGMVTLASAFCGNDPTRSRLYALRLLPPTDKQNAVGQASAEQQTSAALTPLVELAAELAVSVRPLSFMSLQPGHDICNMAAVKQADLVLLGWHKPTLDLSLPGATVGEVIRDARMDVGVFIDRGLARLQKVLLLSGDTPHDAAAARLAERLVQRGAAVTIEPCAPSAEALIEQARHGYDLVVMGLGPKWGASPLQHCPTSLLIVRAAQVDGSSVGEGK